MSESKYIHILHRVAAAAPNSIQGEGAKLCLKTPGSEVTFITELRSQCADNRKMFIALFGIDLVELIEGKSED